MKLIKYPLFLFILLMFIVIACQKKDTTPFTEEPVQVYPTYFYWSDNTITGYAYKADSAFWKYENGYTSIKAYKGGLARNMKINFEGNLNYENSYVYAIYNPSNFTVTSSPALGFKYTDGVITYSSTSSNVLHISDSKSVTTNVNNIISGQFNSVSVSGSGPISVISGTFLNLPNKN